MHRGIYGLLGVAAALGLAVSCKDDPTSTLRGGPALLTLEFDYREVVVRDSVKVTAVVRDEQNNPLPVPITVSIPSSCTAGIASVAPTSAAPLPVTAFFLKGLAYGTTCVVAQSSGLSDTMQVRTFPARISVTGPPLSPGFGPDTLPSGTTVQFTYTYFDAAGNALTGLPAPKWTTATNGTVTTPPRIEPNDTIIHVDTATGLVTGQAPGQVRLTAYGVGSPGGGTQFGKTFVVVPGNFTGTIVPSSGGAGDVIKFVRAGGGPAFDNDTRIVFGPSGALTTYIDTLRTTADSIKVIIPGFGATGSFPFLLTNIGPGQVALKGTFTSSRADFLDPNDPASDDPSTAPTVVGNDDVFGVLHGTCTDGVVTDPGDDCDDFFVVANPLARPDTITVRLDWTQSSAVDVDILWCRTITCSSVTTGGGATAAKPENSTVIIPASTTWYLWINLFDPAGTNHQVFRARVRGRG